MAQSPMQYVMDTIVDALSSDPELSVRRIWRPDAYESTRVLCYPYISQMQYDADAENGLGLGLGRALVEVMCNAMVESDPSEQGIATERAGDIAARVKYAIESYDLGEISGNTDTRFATQIVAMHCDGHVGNFNIGSNKVQMGIALTVTYLIRAV
jgi:hypothetical protein